ncbi:hypothetical protein P7C70_g739, partial [Phenoliferia sp. Uapishka_3]
MAGKTSESTIASPPIPIPAPQTPPRISLGFLSSILSTIRIKSPSPIESHITDPVPPKRKRRPILVLSPGVSQVAGSFFTPPPSKNDSAVGLFRSSTEIEKQEDLKVEETQDENGEMKLSVEACEARMKNWDEDKCRKADSELDQGLRALGL